MSDKNPHKPDKRYQQMQTWLTAILPDAVYKIEIASSDASFRRYFRLITTDQTMIVMDAPPEREAIKPFIEVGQWLKQHNLPVPAIFQQDLTQGFLLLEDLGNTAYLAALNTTSADELYKNAIDCLLKMQQQLCPADLPVYSDDLLRRELYLFDEWFLERHLGMEKPAFLEPLYDFLIASAKAQPQRFVHRDYHSRNLMLRSDGTPGIIDFQDAVCGPVTYDLVSLLRDVYIQWPEDNVTDWMRYYHLKANDAGISHKEWPAFKRDFDLMGLQRHLKILGIFCRLNYRDGKSNYINDLPLTLNYIYKVCALYPELDELADYLQQPNIQKIIL